MGKQTFRITFFVRKARVGKNGLAPILARITINGIAKKMNINCFANPARWDQTKERATGKDRLSNEINTFLDNYRANVVEILNTLRAQLDNRLSVGVGRFTRTYLQLAQRVCGLWFCKFSRSWY